MHLLRRLLAPCLFLAAALASAQTTVPTVTQPVADRTLAVGGAPILVDLRSHFAVPGVTGQVVQVETVLGNFNVELYDDTPLTRANFLAYADSARYANTIIHRSVANFVIQGGGYRAQLPFEHIPTFPPVLNEPKHSNVRGTIAMAKFDGNPNSATSEWFINLANNAANLDSQNGGFTVFGRVIGNGMTVVDAIAALPRFNITGSLQDVPLRDVTPNQGTVEVRNLVTVSNITAIPIYPPAARSVLTFLVQSSSSAVVTGSISGSTLTLTPVGEGTASVTVRARDTNNVFADATFNVTVSSGLTIVAPPQSQHVSPGATVNFSVGAHANTALTYQWFKNGTAIAGATGTTYAIANAQAGDMGFYSVRVSTGANSITSAPATLTVQVPGTSRLVNVSTRGSATAGEPLTPGFVLRGTGTKRLVIRAVGPALAQFSVPGTMPDPRMEIIPLGQSTAVLANNDWQSVPASEAAELVATSSAVGAFELPANSKDAAALANLPVTASGGYTVSIAPVAGTAAGVALAEIYDADKTSPIQLINVSTLGSVTADGLTPGFVIDGTAPKQVLIRAVGPAIAGAPFNVPGALADPQLALIPLGGSTPIASNNDWSDGGQAATLQAAFTAAGAFQLPAGSRDAAMLVRLPPGAYTAVTTGVGGTTGRALVEVYDLDP